MVDADGQIQNGLCDSYEVSDDQKTYTFHIRDNAKWSDGTPVTAQDFEYAWKRNATAQGDYSKFTYQIPHRNHTDHSESVHLRLPRTILPLYWRLLQH